MKSFLFVLFCLFISIFSDNCDKIDPKSESDCLFSNKTNDNNTCCYINGTSSDSQILQKCIEVNFEKYDSYFNDTELRDNFIQTEVGTALSVSNYKCDSDVRESGTYSGQNYLCVGLLVSLSLLF